MRLNPALDPGRAAISRHVCFFVYKGCEFPPLIIYTKWGAMLFTNRSLRDELMESRNAALFMLLSGGHRYHSMFGTAYEPFVKHDHSITHFPIGISID